MPPEASSSVDYATGASPAADTRQDIWALSPAEAGEVLQQAAVEYHQQQVPLAPATAHEANVRLQQLISDPEWSRRLMSGDIATRDEFQRLSELKAAGGELGDAVANEMHVETTVSDTGLMRRDLISAAEDMRADGFPDKAIEHILSDGKFDAQAVYAAQWWLPRMERDPSLLYPDLPLDREYQLKVFRTIAAIGTDDMP
jgi:hypothetical protein